MVFVCYLFVAKPFKTSSPSTSRRKKSFPSITSRKSNTLLANPTQPKTMTFSLTPTLRKLTINRVLPSISPKTFFNVVKNVSQYPQFVPFMNTATIDKSTLKVMTLPDFKKIGKASEYEYFEGFKARVGVGYSDGGGESNSSSMMAESYTSQVKAQVSLHPSSSSNLLNDGEGNKTDRRYVVRSKALDSETFSTLESTWIMKPSDISSSDFTSPSKTNNREGTNLSFELCYQVRSNPLIDAFVRNTFSSIAEKQVAAFIRRGEEEEGREEKKRETEFLS